MRFLYLLLFFPVLITYSCQEDEASALPMFQHPEFIGDWRVHERGEFYQNDSLEFTSTRFFTLQLIDDERGKFILPNEEGIIDILYTYIASKNKVLFAPVSEENFEVPTDTYAIEQKENNYMEWKTVWSFVTQDGDRTEHVFHWEMTKL